MERKRINPLVAPWRAEPEYGPSGSVCGWTVFRGKTPWTWERFLVSFGHARHTLANCERLARDAAFKANMADG